MRHKYITKMIIALVLATALMALLPGCARKGTFEEYSKKNKSFEKVEAAFPSLQVQVDRNEIIFNYDISDMIGDVELSDQIKDRFAGSLEKTLASSEAKYSEQCKDFEKDSGISGLELTVNYTLNGKKLVGRTYTSAGAAKAADSSGAVAATGNTKPKQE